MRTTKDQRRALVRGLLGADLIGFQTAADDSTSCRSVAYVPISLAARHRHLREGDVGGVDEAHPQQDS